MTALLRHLVRTLCIAGIAATAMAAPVRTEHVEAELGVLVIARGDFQEKGVPAAHEVGAVQDGCR